MAMSAAKMDIMVWGGGGFTLLRQRHREICRGNVNMFQKYIDFESHGNELVI